MAPSQLKQLKTSVQARRNNKGKVPKQLAKPLSYQQQQQQKKRPKSLGEETRRQTLLPELQRRHKVGGILDRRIGENDPTMAPEDRALQRYVKQRSKRDSMFNLEDGDDEDTLTHLGGSLLTDGLADLKDDFDAEGLSDANEEEDDLLRPSKRRRSLEDPDDVALDAATEGQPQRKKSKQEVMEEVIAKSKMYKYERQQAKDEDEDLREALDKGLPDLLAALRGGRSVAPPPPPPSQGASIHPERAAQIANGGKPSTAATEKEYDKRLRQLAMDTRAQPTERTKTDEEKAEQGAARLKELEEKRQRRMKGDDESSDDGKVSKEEAQVADEDELEYNEAEEFGLGNEPVAKLKAFDVEDEDDFVIDEDLVASGSDIDTDFSDESEAGEEQEAEDDDDFLQNIQDESNESNKTGGVVAPGASSSLAYTYPCPRNHAQLLDILSGTTIEDLPVIIQRIRALYHPQLHADNKGKVGDFAVSLVDHLSFMASEAPMLVVVESVIRHLHSLSRTYPDGIAQAFRSHLQRIHQSQSIEAGDLFILTAIGSIYPTSDHFHQVVTPAITIMARWLGMTTPSTEKQARIGAYVVALCIKYQTLSKRFVPEALRFTLAALRSNSGTTTNTNQLTNLTAMMDLWADDVAFTEIFSPFSPVLEALKANRAGQKLRIMLSQARLRRRPLELHHHRPLPIKTSVPKYEETFNPDKHYDPDRERAEASKLRAEYKREKKGALRELKKDASFLAREKLKSKKEADKVYEAKQRRLIAEIQGEEGREANIYEREKRQRKGKR